MKNTGHIIQCLCLNYRICKVLVSGFVSRDWQPSKKLIYLFSFQFKRLPLESDNVLTVQKEKDITAKSTAKSPPPSPSPTSVPRTCSPPELPFFSTGPPILHHTVQLKSLCPSHLGKAGCPAGQPAGEHCSHHQQCLDVQRANLLVYTCGFETSSPQEFTSLASHSSISYAAWQVPLLPRASE